MEQKKCQLCDENGHQAKFCPIFRSGYILRFIKKVWYEHIDGFGEEEEEIWPLPEEFVDYVIKHNKRKTSSYGYPNRYPINVSKDHAYFEKKIIPQRITFYQDTILEAKIYVNNNM